MACSVSDPIIHLTGIVGKNQVQEDSNDSRNNEGRLNDQVETLLETRQVNIGSAVVEDLAEPIWLDDIHKANTQAV